MLDVYATFAEDWMAMPVLQGEKTEGEKFPGAVYTLCIEAMMQDRKALQAGTSHFLGQNFAKAFDVKFQDAERRAANTPGPRAGACSTRLIGGLIMTHSDDDGLVLPPRLAPTHVVIVPIFRADEDAARVLEYCHKRRAASCARSATRTGRSASRSTSATCAAATRSGSWIKKGVPLRLEIGPRDMEKDALFVGRRDERPRTSRACRAREFVASVAATLQAIQDGLFAARQGVSASSTRADRLEGRVLRVLHGAARRRRTRRRRSTAASR